MNDVTRSGKPNACQWGSGVTHAGTGEGDLCGPGFIHAYVHPIVAWMSDAMHGNYLQLGHTTRNHVPPRAHLWRCEGVIARHGHHHVGCVELQTIERVELPPFSPHRERVLVMHMLREQMQHRRNRSGHDFLQPFYHRVEAWCDAWLAGYHAARLAVPMNAPSYQRELQDAVLLDYLIDIDHGDFIFRRTMVRYAYVHLSFGISTSRLVELGELALAASTDGVNTETFPT